MVRWYVGVVMMFLMLVVFVCGIIYFHKEKNKARKLLCAVLLIGYFLTITGAFCNSVVSFSNGYKMPVLGGADGKYHCDLTEKSHYPFLADIFFLPAGKYVLVYSVGDALLFLSLPVYILFLVGIIIFKIWQKRKQKIQNKTKT